MWADWLELLCLVNADGLVSKEDALDRMGEQAALNADADVDGAALDDEEENLRDEEPPLASVADRRRVDRRRLRIDDAFRHLEYRQRSYGTCYPFELGPLGTTLRRRPRLTNPNRFYIYLLCAASRERFQRQADRRRLDKSFEQLGAEVLRRWLPGGTEVHVFGTSAGAAGRYHGQLPAKVKQLADDLNEERLLTEVEYRRGNVGDGGVDVVGWIPPLDRASGTLVVFAQASTERNWPHKQSDSSFDRWRHMVTLCAVPLNLMLVPFCFRRPDGDWFLRSEIRSIVMDRHRLTRLVRVPGRLTILPVDLVEEAIAFREAIA